MWQRGAEFAAALRSLARLSERPADDFQLLWAGWPAKGAPPLRLGDLLPHRGRQLRNHGIGGDAGGLVDLVDPSDLLTYQLLAVKRPVGRSHLATKQDRATCILLAAAFFLDVRRAQLEAFLSVGPRHALTPPCSCCGIPTGGWCDICSRPLCTGCDDDGATPCCTSCEAADLVHPASYLEADEAPARTCMRLGLC